MGLSTEHLCDEESPISTGVGSGPLWTGLGWGGAHKPHDEFPNRQSDAFRGGRQEPRGTSETVMDRNKGKHQKTPTAARLAERGGPGGPHFPGNGASETSDAQASLPPALPRAAVQGRGRARVRAGQTPSPAPASKMLLSSEPRHKVAAAPRSRAGRGPRLTHCAASRAGLGAAARASGLESTQGQKRVQNTLKLSFSPCSRLMAALNFS